MLIVECLKPWVSDGLLDSGVELIHIKNITESMTKLAFRISEPTLSGTMSYYDNAPRISYQHGKLGQLNSLIN